MSQDKHFGIIFLSHSVLCRHQRGHSRDGNREAQVQKFRERAPQQGNDVFVTHKKKKHLDCATEKYIFSSFASNTFLACVDLSASTS